MSLSRPLPTVAGTADPSSVAPAPLSAAAQRRLSRFFAALVAAQALGLLAAAALLPSLNLPLLPLRAASSVVGAAGLALLALAGLSSRLRPQWAMALASGSTVLLLCLAMAYHPPRRGENQWGPHGFVNWQSDTDWTEQHIVVDARLGWHGLPDVAARQHHSDFGTVTYRIDAEGWRRMPVVPAPPPRSAVWFLGCSFTFGAGVDDDETFAHRLATQAWPGRQVRNLAHSGWGSSNAYLALQRELQSQAPPAVVLYGWISHHRQRNHLRQSWFARTYAARLPWFELAADGQLQWRGMVAHAQADRPDGPAQDATEVALSVALVRAMARSAHEHGVPFVLLVLQQNDDPVLPLLRQEPGLQILDVSQRSHAVHPNEGHPTRLWHQAVAHAIAVDPLLARLTGIAALHAPQAIADAPMRHMRLSVNAGLPRDRGTSHVLWPQQAGQPLRAQVVPSQVGDPWSIVLKGPAQPLRQGQAYALTLRVRSDAPRQLPLVVSRDRPPWGHLGLSETLSVGPEWQTVRRVFVANADALAEPLLLLGGAAGEVALADQPLLEPVAAAEAPAAKAAPGPAR